MLFVRLILSLLILPSFIFPHQVYGQTQTAKNGEMLYQKVLMIAEKKAEAINRLLPPGNVMIVKSEKDLAVKEELKKRISTLENATNLEVAEIKKAILRINEQELSEMGKELRGHLNAFSESEILSLAQVINESPQYLDQKLEIESSFTINEKREAITSALQEDLGFLRSIYNKKLGLSTKDQLKKDYENNLATFERQQSTKGNNSKILQISLMALAGVALITWGISSAVYGARLSHIRSDREAKLAELQRNLAAQYQTYKDQITKEELDYLKSNGYMRMVCGTFDQPDSILCNRYNYKLFNGQKHCSVYCYKNIQTGKETLHEPAICTSPFIPTDCYDPKEYWDAYARGDSDGYDDGYDHGYNDGDNDGYSDGRSDGAYDGHSDGYDSGYSDGYDDGYSWGASGGKSAHFIPMLKSENYLKGYKDGVEQYQILFLNF